MSITSSHTFLEAYASEKQPPFGSAEWLDRLIEVGFSKYNVVGGGLGPALAILAQNGVTILHKKNMLYFHIAATGLLIKAKELKSGRTFLDKTLLHYGFPQSKNPWDIGDRNLMMWAVCWASATAGGTLPGLSCHLTRLFLEERAGSMELSLALRMIREVPVVVDGESKGERPENRAFYFAQLIQQVVTFESEHRRTGVQPAKRTTTDD